LNTARRCGSAIRLKPAELVICTQLHAIVPGGKSNSPPVATECLARRKTKARRFENVGGDSDAAHVRICQCGEQLAKARNFVLSADHPLPRPGIPTTTRLPRTASYPVDSEAGNHFSRFGKRMADLNTLVIFAKVVEANSFSEAARRLKMPISSVSRRIAELEKLLGIRAARTFDAGPSAHRHRRWYARIRAPRRRTE
jgi:hypothetical protein